MFKIKLKNVKCFLVLLYVLLSLGECKRKHENQNRIVGGTTTTISKVPYLINLRSNNQFICGGSIITNKCILTAGHCVYGTTANSLSIQAGASRLSESGMNAFVEQYFISPLYNPISLDMDVAILKLKQPLQLGNDVAPIALCRSKPADNQFVQISGWGLTNEFGTDGPDQVRTANVKVVPKMQCIANYAGKAQVTSTMFCATIPGEKDSCSGDSGGPVVSNGQVCGIVSWGFGCARSEYPGVYTNLGSVRVQHFVSQVIKQNC